MRRREFIGGLGGAASFGLLPLAARAQRRAMPVIGVMSSGASDGRLGDNYGAFRQGLNDSGFIEGRNAAVEYRGASGQYDRLPAFAAELVHRQVDVLVATGGPSALVAKAATTTIPIVFVLGFDPVALGLVASLSRPGGNLTGVTSLANELGPKRLELLHEAVPATTSIVLLVNPTEPTAEAQSKDLHASARALGLRLSVLRASTEGDLDAAFSTAAQLGAGALVIGIDVFFLSRSELLAALAVRHALPAIFQYRPFAAAGGLMSYGGDLADQFRLAGAYAGRILKGEKPADLPVQQTTKVELIINLKAAKALGVTFPITLLGRADEVIE